MYAEYVEFGTNWGFKTLQGILECVPRDKGKMQESVLEKNETLQIRASVSVREELEI